MAAGHCCAPVSWCPPRPVELHGACTGRTATSERLALAIRLARRDLQRSLALATARPLVTRVAEIPADPAQDIPHTTACVTALPTTTECVGVPVSCQVASDVRGDERQPGCTAGREDERQRGCAAGSEDERQAGSGAGREDETQPGSAAGRATRAGGKNTEEGDSELRQLKMALAQQVQRLQELCARERAHDDEEEEDERDKKRAAEKVSVTARKLYDLQRQVLIADNWGGKQTIRRLAAARRAATRTLQSFSSSSCPPQQLLELLGQLCGDRQSSELLAQAQMYSESLRNSRQQREAPLTPGRAEKTRRAKKGGSRGRWKRGIRHQSRDRHRSRAKSPPLTRPQQRKQRGRDSSGAPELEAVETTSPQAPSLSLPHTSASQPHPSPHPQPPPHHTPPPTRSPQAPSLSPPHTLVSQPHQPKPPSHHTSPTTQGAQKLLFLPHLVSMTTTLQSMVEAEEVIFHKWQGEATLGHSQAAVTSPTARSERELTARSEGDTGGGLQLKGLCHLHKSRSAHSQQWLELERLADQLLQEAVGQVCTELQEASDSLAAQLFSQEFHITTAV